jgi:hypothetical protein
VSKELAVRRDVYKCRQHTYCDTHRKPSPYPCRCTIEHIKISIGRISLSGTLPCKYRSQSYVIIQCAECTNLASGLIETEMMSELLLAHSSRSINLVTKDKERNLVKFLNGEQSVELRFGLSESFKVRAVN